MRPAWILACLLAAVTPRCSEPKPHLPPADPKPGEYVRIRGTLDDDVDCRLLRSEGGKVYSLNAKLPNYPNGTRACIQGTISTISPCLHGPSIDVEQIRGWGSCP